ncbi:Ankyrin repeat family A protein 2 [Symbiodinium microadriaticum]|uniref:Ankyrin repeat family A protein 2 n=1 Tax=Symbiodinium microadriaticum TaxID=2951 RepID=A0A1Q9EUN6_SYMMI|nr:Ankyrin repeat family A protein 2 [Symbiodinium microadriaticum]
MLACAQGNVDLVRRLLEAGADTNLADKDGATALMMAAGGRGVEIVRLLLDAGADKATIISMKQNVTPGNVHLPSPVGYHVQGHLKQQAIKVDVLVLVPH